MISAYHITLSEVQRKTYIPSEKLHTPKKSYTLVQSGLEHQSLSFQHCHLSFLFQRSNPLHPNLYTRQHITYFVVMIYSCIQLLLLETDPSAEDQLQAPNTCYQRQTLQQRISYRLQILAIRDRPFSRGSATGSKYLLLETDPSAEDQLQAPNTCYQRQTFQQRISYRLQILAIRDRPFSRGSATGSKYLLLETDASAEDQLQAPNTCYQRQTLQQRTSYRLQILAIRDISFSRGSTTGSKYLLLETDPSAEDQLQAPNTCYQRQTLQQRISYRLQILAIRDRPFSRGSATGSKYLLLETGPSAEDQLQAPNTCYQRQTLQQRISYRLQILAIRDRPFSRGSATGSKYLLLETDPSAKDQLQAPNTCNSCTG